MPDYINTLYIPVSHFFFYLVCRQESVQLSARYSRLFEYFQLYIRVIQ